MPAQGIALEKTWLVLVALQYQYQLGKGANSLTARHNFTFQLPEAKGVFLPATCKRTPWKVQNVAMLVL